MSRTQEFNLLDSPLEGTSLIEASAGTGKTYTLTALYLRFVLEEGLTPEQILVVTFTEAATKELRDRIRKGLREAADGFSGAAVEDEFIKKLVARADDSGVALTRLLQALRDFDQAAIFTIHGFCQRMLHENAFEASSLFDTELVTDQRDLKREILEDFWRKHFYAAPPYLVHYALAKGYTPETFFSLLQKATGVQEIKIIPEVQQPEPEDIEKSVAVLLQAVDTLARTWPEARREVMERLRDPALNATSYGNQNKTDATSGLTLRDVKINRVLRAMDAFLRTRDATLPIPSFEEFTLLTADKLSAATKKNQKTPSHAIFDLCQVIDAATGTVQEALSRYFLWLKTRALQYLTEELPLRKQKQNIQHFDDLLLNLKRGLEQPGGETLAAAVREKYRAALIDEFQDTDPIQYAIFRNVFRDGQRSLYLIGDPKQAIYSFRGADLFTYMEAAKQADRKYTLGTNWRSEPQLIRAVNTLFAGASNPFVYSDIEFQPAAPPPGKQPQPLLLEGRAVPPMKLWFLGPSQVEDTGKPINRPLAQERIDRVVAAEISRLLTLAAANRAMIGQNAVRASDIAVLVRTNQEARLLQQALAHLRIPCVLHSTEDVFDSAEAGQMERVLAAIAEPHQEGLVRAALATDILGIGGEDLALLLTDENRWEETIVRFRNYSQMWHEHGFIRMFRHFMLQEKIRSRLVSFSNGERRLTNLLHICEVLHQESVAHKLGAAELLKWLFEQRDPQRRSGSEHQLRLESDENAVRLVTIHKSKGLEYPVVFCPFTWGESRLKKSDKIFAFHDESDGRKLTLDLGSEDSKTNRVFAEKEILAENMRLLYVALTRAKSRCYLVWGLFNTAQTSAPAYLLHQRGACGSLDIVAETEAAFRALDEASMFEQLREIEEKSNGCIQLEKMPLEEGREYTPPGVGREMLQCRTFSGAIDRSWRISSFSALVSNLVHGAELPDRDESDLASRPQLEDLEAERVRQQPQDIFAFPRGPKAGTLLHDIFEQLDFTENQSGAVEELVEEKLGEYGFEAKWRETLCSMIRRVLAVPLGIDGECFSLCSIPNRDRLSELEFYYPLRFLEPEFLETVFARHRTVRPLPGGNPQNGRGTPAPPRSDAWPEGSGRLKFQPVRGFMKGFMDLVFRYGEKFYLVDWKSNHLGNGVEDYAPQALAAAMDREFYTLQYHLYVVALDRYLSRRLAGYSYERHFGGVFYMFLRGVDPEVGPHYGVFKDRPAPDLTRALCHLLIAREGGDTMI